MSLLLVAIAALAVSGVPDLFFGRRAALGQVISVLLASVGALLGLAATVRWLVRGDEASLNWPWTVPGGRFHVEIDGIAAVFLFPIFLIALLGSIYGLGYWKQAAHPDNGRKLSLFWGLLAAAMALVVLARNAVLFIFGWEVMALSAYFLITTEDHDSDVLGAGWLYLVATHVSTLLLFALFGLLQAATGTFELLSVPASVSPGIATAVFLLALVGFGIKAGIMPLHVWLPSSHAMAPSHVSALLSGVIIKMGIYGLVRITSLIPNPPVWWGVLMLCLGVVSGVLGVAFAVGQHDLKRLLAYHSIENIGIIVMGLGLALIGRSLDQPIWIALGLGGALLHVWNHALFKSLLFFSAGSVIHAVQTREIDALGGLAKAMPRTAFCFLIGATAICGLPPLNGFVSELLIYLGLFRTLGLEGSPSYVGAAFAAPALALIGALAVACFVKVFGAVFLGAARSHHADHAHESPFSMIGPMLVLVACCLAIGLAPLAVAPVLERGIGAWLPSAVGGELGLAKLAPLGWTGMLGLGLFGAIALGSSWLAVRLRRSPAQIVGTWDCGYAAPSARMQYTSSSFAEMLVGMFGWALRPKIQSFPVVGLFPRSASFSSDVQDVVLDEVVWPAARGAARGLYWFRWLQQGSLQAYLLYILVTVLVLLFWH